MVNSCSGIILDHTTLLSMPRPTSYPLSYAHMQLSSKTERRQDADKMQHSRHNVQRGAVAMHHMRKMCFLKIKVRKSIILGRPK